MFARNSCLRTSCRLDEYEISGDELKKEKKKRESGNHLISVQKENMVIAIDHLLTFVWSRTTPLDEPFSTVYICPTKEANFTLIRKNHFHYEKVSQKYPSNCI
jgi:hypothetical protein